MLGKGEKPPSRLTCKRGKKKKKEKNRQACLLPFSEWEVSLVFPAWRSLEAARLRLGCEEAAVPCAAQVAAGRAGTRSAPVAGQLLRAGNPLRGDYSGSWLTG